MDVAAHLRLIWITLFTQLVPHVLQAQQKWPEPRRLNGFQPIEVTREVHVFTALDAKTQTLWLRIQNPNAIDVTHFDLISVSLSDGSQKNFKPMSMEYMLPMAWIDSLSEMRFWDNTAGRVWRWRPGEDSLTRVDYSFKHYNQGGHTAFVNPKDASIMVYGGFGFWTVKNYFSQYDTLSNEWHLVYAKNPEVAPFLINAAGALDLSSRTAYLVGGKVSETHLQNESTFDKPSFSIYPFDIQNRTFLDPIQIHIPNIVEIAGLFPSVTNPGTSVYSAAPHFSPKHRTLLLFGTLNQPGKISIQSSPGDIRESVRPALLHIDSGKLWINSNFQLDATFGIHLLDMIWLESKETFIAIGITVSSNLTSRKLVFYEIPMKEFYTRFEADLDDLHPFGFMYEYSELAFPFALFLLFPVGFYGARRFVVKRKSRSHSGPEVHTQPEIFASYASEIPEAPRVNAEKEVLLLKLLPEPVFSIGKSGSLKFHQPFDRNFLAALLLERYLRGQGIESTELDEIMFLPNATNDYLRKVRSESIASLNTTIHIHMGIEHAVYQEKSALDKRRSVYFVHEQVLERCVIESPTKPVSETMQRTKLFKSLKSVLPANHRFTPLFETGAST